MAVPTDYTGLLLWLDADDSATITDAGSGAVSLWEDKSGNSNDFQQTSGAERPITGTATINSKNVIDFDGSNDYLFASDFTSSITEAEFFIVFEVDADPSAGYGSSGLWWFTGIGSGMHLPGPTGDSNWYDPTASSSSRKTITDPAASLTTPRIYNVRAESGGAWSAYVDGASVHSTTGNTVSLGNAPHIGISYGGGPFYLAGRIAEIVIYDNVLSSGDRTGVYDYLDAKWFGGGGTDATATPATIVASATLPAVTPSAGQVTAPATIAAVATLPAATATRSETPTPASIVAPVAMDAVATSAGGSSSPATIVASATLPAVTPSAGSSTAPATIAVIAALDAVAASGGGSSTAAPATIVATVAMDAVTPSAGSSTAPATIVSIITIDQAIGTRSSDAAPATIIATAILNAVTLNAGATPSPASIAVVITSDPVIATGEGSAIATPATLVATVAVPAVTATGETVYFYLYVGDTPVDNLSVDRVYLGSTLLFG